MAALKAVGKRGSVPLVDCGPVCSPGVDLERVAPSHTGMTQLSIGLSCIDYCKATLDRN